VRAKAVSIGCRQCGGGAAGTDPRGVRPDAVTDQTSAHDPVNGYLPEGWTLVREWEAQAQKTDPGRGHQAAARANPWPSMCARCWNSRAGHPRPSTTATTSARSRSDEGVENAFDFPGFVPAYIRPLFCRGIGPFRWAALSGDPEDIYKTDAAGEELFPDEQASASLARHGARAHPVPGPARAHLLGRLGDRHRAGLAFNEMVASGRA
jgi:urocanate hydratase